MQAASRQDLSRPTGVLDLKTSAAYARTSRTRGPSRQNPLVAPAARSAARGARDGIKALTEVEIARLSRLSRALAVASALMSLRRPLGNRRNAASSAASAATSTARPRSEAATSGGRCRQIRADKPAVRNEPIFAKSAANFKRISSGQSPAMNCSNLGVKFSEICPNSSFANPRSLSRLKLKAPGLLIQDL